MSSPPPKPVQSSFRRCYPAWAVLIVGLIITGAATLFMKSSVDTRARYDFVAHCVEVQNKITGRLYDHARILRSAAAFYNASDLVTREKWHTYTKLQKIEQQLPGIQGIGFSLLIPKKDLQRHSQEIRREGFPEYTVHPAGDRERYSSIIYLEPFSGLNLRAFGYDMLSEPTRRAAMELAEDTDSAALSGKVVLMQETDSNVQAGSLMYVPVYHTEKPTDTVEQRRAAILGWVYSAYRMNDLMQGILGSSNQESEHQLHLQIFDGEQPSPQSLLYACHQTDNDKIWRDVHQTIQVPVYFNGQRWTLRFAQTGGGLTSVGYIRVWLTLAGGLLITLLLFALVRAQLATRDAALLRENEERFRTMANSAPVLVWIAGTDKLCTWFNQVWLEFTGRTLEQEYGNGWAEGVHPDDMDLCLATYSAAFDSRQKFSMVYRLRRADGQYRWLIDNGIPIFDRNEFRGYIGSCIDITASKLLEEALREAKSKLGEQNDALQATEEELRQQIDQYEVVQTQLQETTSVAESANSAKSQFLATMSHEIRTPMNGVLGMTQLLEFTDLSVEQREYVALLKLSGNNLLSLINDILDLSKIEAGKLEIEKSEFSLSVCIRDLALMQKSVISAKGLKLDLNIAEDVPNVLIGDQLRIKQILLNLLGNAVKFTAQGKISISVQLLEKHDNQVLVQLAVRDSGIGIAPEALDTVFKAFAQEDGSTTRRFGGTGLGLTISRRLAELMGGLISVYSTQGVGSCFTVTLPFMIGCDTTTAAAVNPITTFGWDGPPLRILFVEDDHINITFGSSLLKKLGFDFIVAENGRECLAALEKGTFDLVLMDIQMPFMNGEEALLEIRTQERESGVHIPVIAVTAYSMRGDKDRFLNEGFDGYVSKPITTAVLVKEIKRVVGESAAVQ